MKAPLKETSIYETGVDPVSPAVTSFAEHMQLRLNGSGRRGYHQAVNSALLSSLEGNVSQLHTALVNGDPHEIVWRASDVANYAMFIALNTLRKTGYD